MSRADAARTRVLVAVAIVVLVAVGTGSPARAADAPHVVILEVASGDGAALAAQVEAFKAKLLASDNSVQVTDLDAVQISRPSGDKVADPRIKVDGDGRVSVSWTWNGNDGGLPAWAEVTLRSKGKSVGIRGYEPASSTNHTFEGVAGYAAGDLEADVVIRNGLSPEVAQDKSHVTFGLSTTLTGSASARRLVLDWTSADVTELAKSRGDDAPLCQPYVAGAQPPAPVACSELQDPFPGRATIAVDGPEGAIKTAVLAVTINGKVITTSVPFTVPPAPDGPRGTCASVSAPSPRPGVRSLLDAAVEVEKTAQTKGTVVTASDLDVAKVVATTCGVFKGQERLRPSAEGVPLAPLASVASSYRPITGGTSLDEVLGRSGPTVGSTSASVTTLKPTTATGSNAAPVAQNAGAGGSGGDVNARGGSSIVAPLLALLLVVVAGLTVLFVVLARRGRQPAIEPAHALGDPSSDASPPTDDVALPDLVPAGLRAAPVDGAAAVLPTAGPPETPSTTAAPALVTDVAVPLPVTPPSSLPPGCVRLADDEVAAPDGVVVGGAEDIAPERSELGCVWGSERPGLQVAALWLERRTGKGEDAQPSFVLDPATGTGLLATYDGTGGSGAAPAQLDADGADLSGAYVAGRLARRVTEEWFAGILNAHDTSAAPEAELHAALAERFSLEAARSVPSSEKFVGSLRRDLPTTIAAAVFHAASDRIATVTLSAGDSRCHVLTPSAGLQQVSVDDTRVSDALEAIVTDAPMTNLVSADRPFVVHRRDLAIASPAILLSSTDGCFGYVATPAHFEYLLLEGLRTAETSTQWASNVLAQLENFTGDDASLVIVALGWPDFTSLKGSFVDRTALLKQVHWDPFAALDPADHEQLSSLRMASWRPYKQFYEQHLRLPDPEVSPALLGAEEGGGA